MLLGWVQLFVCLFVCLLNTIKQPKQAFCLVPIHFLLEFLNQCFIKGRGLGLWCLSPLPQYFSYIMAVSFIGRGTGENNRPVASH
jgi:hypothetical protein